MKFLILLIAFLFSTQIYSTPQIPDILKYNGQEFELHSFSPAHKYFKDKGFTAPKEAIETTANYGIFLFTYEIIDKKLYLTDVEILVKKETESENNFFDIESKSMFKNYFPNDDKILMNTTKIVLIPYGEEILTITEGWSDYHSEKYLIFEFENGKVNKSLDLNYQEFLKECKNQFKKFKKTDQYRKLKNSKELKDDLKGYNLYRPKKLHIKLDQYIEKRIFNDLDYIR